MKKNYYSAPTKKIPEKFIKVSEGKFKPNKIPYIAFAAVGGVIAGGFALAEAYWGSAIGGLITLLGWGYFANITLWWDNVGVHYKTLRGLKTMAFSNIAGASVYENPAFVGPFTVLLQNKKPVEGQWNGVMHVNLKMFEARCGLELVVALQRKGIAIGQLKLKSSEKGSAKS